MEEPLRLSDLIPRRPLSYLLLGALCVAVVTVLAALHVVSRLYLSHRTTDGTVAALDLDAEGNLAAWFSFTLLLLSAQFALVLRHLAGTAPLRSLSGQVGIGAGGDGDTALSPLLARDGCGVFRRRRVRSSLLFTALVCLLMSVDEGASLHEGFKEMIARILGTPLYGDGSVYWIVPYFLLLAAMGWRLLGIMGVTPAGFMLLATGGFWALAVANQLELFFASAQAGIVMEECCEMLGYTALLGSLLLLGRQWIVATEAEGTKTPAKPQAAPTQRRVELIADR